MGERIELVLGKLMWASFHLSCPVLKVNTGISINKGTSLWNFVPNSGLWKFRHGIDRLNVLSTKLDKGGRSERDKLDRRRSTNYLRALTVDR